MNAILILLSLVCVILAIRGVLTEPLEGSRFDSFFFINLVLAAAFAYLPVKQQMLEAHMEKAVEKLLVMQDVDVYCQSFWDTFYNRLGVAGFVYRGTHKIILEPRTCDGMAGYLDNPGSASDAELFSLHVLTMKPCMSAASMMRSRQTAKPFSAITSPRACSVLVRQRPSAVPFTCISGGHRGIPIIQQNVSRAAVSMKNCPVLSGSDQPADAILIIMP